MAELILNSVVGSIARHLVSLLSQEIGQARGVNGELHKLQVTVSAVGALLREAEKRQIQAEDVKDWLEKLKDLVYDADDLLDDYSTEALRRRIEMAGGGKRIMKGAGIFFSSSNQLIYPNKMARRVKDIRERIDAITDDRVRFQLEGGSDLGSSMVNPIRLETYSSEPEENVIGRDKDKEEIIEFLLNPDFEDNVTILPIVGLGGIGKTTLVRLVFNDESVKKHFMSRDWVTVSTNFDVEDILRKIIEDCTSDEELPNPNTNALEKGIRAKLDGKRFLLVLDDVWNDNRREWLNLQRFFINGAKGSKVLVTTRTLRVARTMTTEVHELGGLDEEKSLSLLMRMAMKQEHEWRNQNLERIAKDILKKCSGVPLAITTIGRLLLFSRNTEEEWLKFRKNDLSRINQEEGDILPTLKLSYTFLPSHLKRCFTYCGVFPKDYELDPSSLVHLWMAQGFINPVAVGNEQTLQEVGQEYFMELVWRSFFQDIVEDTCGNIIACKMHDLMHDLAQSLAQDCITVNSSQARTAPEKARHVTVVDMEDYESTGFEITKKVRSLFFITSENSRSIEISQLDVSFYRNLRALYVHGVQIKAISSSIGKLKLLRCLDLSNNSKLRFLPKSISKLCNLETLNLRGCWRLETLPAGITELVKLRQLDVSYCYGLTHMPRGIGKLTSLQSLGLFVVGDGTSSNAARLSELSMLTGLRKTLNVRHLERLGSISSDVDVTFPVEKLALQSLHLRWNSTEYRAKDEEILERFRPHPDLQDLFVMNYGRTRLSSWIRELNKLVKIAFSECHGCTSLPPLDQLPFVKSVSVSSMEKLEYIALSENGRSQQLWFPSLEEIVLARLPKFRGWDEEEEEEGRSSLPMLAKFSDKVRVDVVRCPRFSCVHGQRLIISTMKSLQQLVKDVACDPPQPSVSSSPTTMAFISIPSMSLSAVTSLSIHWMEDADHLPVELFQSLPCLQSLKVRDCPRLKSLPVRAILMYLVALETLTIFRCEELDITNADDDSDSEHLQGCSRIRHLTIEGVDKMETLPRWFRYLSNLEHLRISSCGGLKFLSGSIILRHLTSLETLHLRRCPELDWSEEIDDPEGMGSLQMRGPIKLQSIEFVEIDKITRLPWWVQWLSNLENLSLIRCSNLKALPEWFPNLTSLKQFAVPGCGELSRRCRRNTGQDWPKISHIRNVL